MLTTVHCSLVVCALVNLYGRCEQCNLEYYIIFCVVTIIISPTVISPLLAIVHFMNKIQYYVLCQQWLPFLC